MRVTALLPYPYDIAPGQRYRIEQWQEPLRTHGIDLELNFLLTDRASVSGLWKRPPSARALADLAVGTMRRTLEIARHRPPDAWFLFREATMIGPPLLERLAAMRAPIVFDYDDAIWLSANDKPTLADRVRQPSKTGDILRMSSGVSAGNAYLAAYASRFCPIVDVVPTTIDTTRTYTRRKVVGGSGPLVVGWSGSHSTVKYIRELLPVLADVGRTVPFRLLIIGVTGVTHPDLDIECRPWRSATELDDILDIDVGLMPLVDDAWARGKCGLKALQYMAAGIPAVISPVGVNTEIVTDGENGFLASVPVDWQRAITALTDPALRARLGAAARATVERRYSADVSAAKLAALLRRVRPDLAR
jgi:glycosyltransferase involved in cell wall biosynthesis